MRLKDKSAIIFGAGQAPGASEAIGNGRATALTFAREGARVCCVDRHLESAETTAGMVGDAGGTAMALQADVTDEAAMESAVAQCLRAWARIDILHNNVGVSVEGGDAALGDVTAAAFDRIMDVNLLGTMLACKHVLPIMRDQRAGAIVNISSASAYWTGHPTVLYPASKMAMVSFTRQLAIQNADRGVRANTILPGLMDTPMAVDRRVETLGRSREDIAAERDARVPLLGKMGNGWDVANAALFLASDEARFITGIEMPVDGGSLARVG
jgi:NAD(P)-dependent dehydrogenase (short-subunit alcohol dehydrogenase family)